jgi:histidyl-tRNA synthetase
VDKLDKESWEAVRAELVDTKNVDGAVADRIGELVKNKGEPRALLAQLRETAVFAGNAKGEKALAEMEVLFDYLAAYDCLARISFDLSLARGLDYYTGIIFEVVYRGAEGRSVGSIAGGGRYDELIGMFSQKGKSLPSVGFSLGVERIFVILEKKVSAQNLALLCLFFILENKK